MNTEPKRIIEAALLAAGRPLTLDELDQLFEAEQRPGKEGIKTLLMMLEEDYESRVLELKKVATGIRFQVREGFSPWLSKLFEERPARYSRAFLETLAIIAYRQPVTRGEIEEIRGVAVNSTIIRSLQEREWIRVLGHKELPGRPALFGTTPGFLDYFGLASLEALPPLHVFIEAMTPPDEGGQNAQLTLPLAAEDPLEPAHSIDTVVDGLDQPSDSDCHGG